MTVSTQPAPVILRRKQLEARIGLGRSSIYDRINPESRYYDPTFPKPIKLGSGKNPPVGFIEAEVNAWLNAQISKSRAANLLTTGNVDGQKQSAGVQK